MTPRGLAPQWRVSGNHWSRPERLRVLLQVPSHRIPGARSVPDAGVSDALYDYKASLGLPDLGLAARLAFGWPGAKVRNGSGLVAAAGHLFDMAASSRE